MLSLLTSRWRLWGILLLAIALRLWGIGHDLPHSYLPDEAHFVKRALSFGSGDPNPHWFHKPAFYMYLLYFEYGIQFLVGRAAGWWSSVTDFALLFLENPSSFYLIGRLTTVAFGVGGIYAVYCIGAKNFGVRAGLVAALLLTLSFGHVEASRVVKADVPAATINIWSFFFLMRYLVDARWKNLALAGALAGMATATKYYAILMLIPLSASPWLSPLQDADSPQPRMHRLRHLMIGLFAFWTVYFVCSPYNFLDPLGREWTLRPFGQVWQRATEFAGGESPNEADEVWKFRRGKSSVGEGIVDYVDELFGGEGLGPLIAAFGLLGLVSVWRQGGRAGRLLAVYALMFAFVSAVLFPGRAQPRHQVPLYPFLAVAGGVLFARMSSRFGQNRWLSYAALAVVLCLPSVRIVSHAMELTKEETRNVAKRWIESNLAAETKLIVDENGPPLLVSEVVLDRLATHPADEDGQFTAHFDTLVEYQRLAARRNKVYEVDEIRRPWWRSTFAKSGTYILESEFDRDYGNPLRPVGVESYDYYVQHGFEYAIVHSEAYEDFVLEGSRLSQRYPAFDRFYRDVFQRAELIEVFQPGLNLRGPTVKVFRLTSNSE